MKNLIVVFLIASFFLTSCDPIHYISFANNSNSNAKVKLNLNSKAANYDLEQIAVGDSIVFHLKSKGTQSIYFGIGTWETPEIDELLTSVNSLEIETSEIKTIYKTKKAMKEILENNEKGFWLKTEIAIKIE